MSTSGFAKGLARSGIMGRVLFRESCSEILARHTASMDEVKQHIRTRFTIDEESGTPMLLHGAKLEWSQGKKITGTGSHDFGSLYLQPKANTEIGQLFPKLDPTQLKKGDWLTSSKEDRWQVLAPEKITSYIYPSLESVKLRRASDGRELPFDPYDFVASNIPSNLLSFRVRILTEGNIVHELNVLLPKSSDIDEGVQRQVIEESILGLPLQTVKFTKQIQFDHAPIQAPAKEYNTAFEKRPKNGPPAELKLDPRTHGGNVRKNDTGVMLVYMPHGTKSPEALLKGTAYVVFHEHGHNLAYALWDSHVPPKEWENAIATDLSSIREYSKTNIQEDFATAVEAYLLYRAGLGYPDLPKSHPNRFALIERILSQASTKKDIERENFKIYKKMALVTLFRQLHHSSKLSSAWKHAAAQDKIPATDANFTQTIRAALEANCGLACDWGGIPVESNRFQFGKKLVDDFDSELDKFSDKSLKHAELTSKWIERSIGGIAVTSLLLYALVKIFSSTESEDNDVESRPGIRKKSPQSQVQN